MKTLYLTTHFKDADSINLNISEKPKPTISSSECLVRVASSGINPSDALACLGYFKQAHLPRIPGRDFSGTVVDGDVDLIGKQIWGSGGAAGVEFDGTQAQYIIIPSKACAEIPKNMDLFTAGAQTLPYVTAYYGLVTRSKIKAGETVVVVGAVGQVGRAAMSISKWKKCNPIALVRGSEELQEAQSIMRWQAVDSTDKQFAEQILEINKGKPVNVIFNSIGNLLWDKFLNMLAPFGRILTISARDGQRTAAINLFDLYRNNQDLININTIALDYTANSHLLNELRPGFEAGILQPLPIEASTTFALSDATRAYQTVAKGGEANRVVIDLAEE